MSYKLFPAKRYTYNTRHNYIKTKLHPVVPCVSTTSLLHTYLRASLAATRRQPPCPPSPSSPAPSSEYRACPGLPCPFKTCHVLSNVRNAFHEKYIIIYLLWDKIITESPNAAQTFSASGSSFKKTAVPCQILPNLRARPPQHRPRPCHSRPRHFRHPRLYFERGAKGEEISGRK